MSDTPAPTSFFPQFPDLKDASVFITGGGKGIGAALSEGFIAQNANVAFIQRSDATEFCKNMERTYQRSPLFIQGDITNTSDIKRAFTQAVKAHGPVTILVNNAANDDRHQTLDIDEAYWDQSQSVNLRSYFFTSQTMLRVLRDHGKDGKKGSSLGVDKSFADTHASIINITSISYMMGLSEYPSYVTANAGIVGLTRALAREFGKVGVRVNALAPGWVITDKQKQQWATPQALADHLQRQCILEHLTPHDIIGPVLFLSSRSSRMVTGQTLVVDGGVVTSG